MKVLIVASGNRSKISSFILEQVNSLKALDVMVDYFLIKGKGFFGYVKNYFLLLRKIKTNNYELIHAHYGLSGLLASLQLKLPVIITFHGSDVNLDKNYLFSRLAASLSTNNIFVHPSIYQKLKSHNKKSHIIPCGIDLDIFQPMAKLDARKILGFKKNEKLILFSSSFQNPIKNPILAKEAISKIENCSLLELKDYNRKEVKLLMNAVDLLLVTSYSETGPLVVKEALACNCPVVSTDVGDVKKITNGISNCFIIDKNIEEIIEKVNIILSSKKRSNGQDRVQSFELKIVAKIIYDIYLKAIVNTK